MAPANAVQRFVEPGNGGGTGTASDPFKGLAAAQSAARPGDLFLLRPGSYDGEFDVTKSDEPGKPIIWRGAGGAGGAGGGESIIQGTGINDSKPTVAIEANNIHDVWFESIPNMVDCDFDYDGFAGGPFAQFLKWNSVKYATLDDVKARAPVYKHAALLDPANLFQSGLKAPDDPNIPIESAKVDLRLKDSSAAVDAGVVLPGFNDGFKGKAPDLGAYELGAELPHYGPRPEK